ncbi:MAG: response regulator [Gammaproteobacteria bacterium]
MPCRVLAVDDEPLFLDVLRDLLQDAGYEVDCETDSGAAWEALRSGSAMPDIIVLDWCMPAPDGMELLARIKADPVLRSRPVIMVTAYTDKAHLIEGLKAGASYYLTKPFDYDEFRAIVAAAEHDAVASRELQERVHSGQRALGFLTHATFHVRTLEQVRVLGAFLAQACPQPERAAFGLNELLINAVEHGNLGIHYAEKSRLIAAGTLYEEIDRRLAEAGNRDKQVRVDFSRDGDEVRIRIRDQGRGFQWQRYLEFDADRAFDCHGRGIAMSRAMSFDRVEYFGCGNEVCVTLRADAPAADPAAAAA